MDFISYIKIDQHNNIKEITVSNEILSHDWLPIPTDDQCKIDKYRKYDPSTGDFYDPIEIEVIVTNEDIIKDTRSIDMITTLTSDDALTIMELQLDIDDKLNKIIAHLGIQ